MRGLVKQFRGWWRRESSRGVAVWDWPVRLFHWALVASVTVAALTGFFARRTTLQLHLIAGGVITALLVARIVWAFTGGGYARLASFAFRTREVLAYMRALRGPHAPRHLGHNPLGAMMVFAKFVMLGLILLTGTIVLGGMLKQGPLAHDVTYAAGAALKIPHKLLALILVAMIAVHIGGVWYESRRERDNLALAMVTGRKSVAPDAPPPPAAPARPRLAGALAIVLLLGGTGGIVALAARPGLGVPPPPPHAYTSACSDCHMAYPASLLPAASWAAMLGDLSHHFGEDASLDPASLAHVRSYLLANGAGRWDTLAAVRIRTTLDPRQPGKITASRFWLSMHHRLSPALLHSKAIGSPANCAACHLDAATGRFAPQKIAVPEASE